MVLHILDRKGLKLVDPFRQLREIMGGWEDTHKIAEHVLPAQSDKTILSSNL